jgi:hypothetical protein
MAGVVLPLILCPTELVKCRMQVSGTMNERTKRDVFKVTTHVTCHVGTAVSS